MMWAAVHYPDFTDEVLELIFYDGRPDFDYINTPGSFLHIPETHPYYSWLVLKGFRTVWMPDTVEPLVRPVWRLVLQGPDWSTRKNGIALKKQCKN